MNKITEIIPDDLPKWAENATTNGEFFKVVVELVSERDENIALRQALEEIVEIYAGMEGLFVNTTGEKYLTRQLLETYKIAAEALK